MRKTCVLLLILALCCVSCAGKNQEEVVKLAPGPDAEINEVDKDCSYFYFLWGKSAELQGKFEEAREAYEKSLVCDPSGIHVMRKLAVLLINMGKKQESAGWINKIIAMDPKDINSRSLLANLYSTMDEFDKAVEIYSQILTEEPDNLNVSLLLGSLYARKRDFNKAREVLEALVAKNEDSFIAYHYLAKLYRDLRLTDKADGAYQKALDLNWSSMLAFEYAEFLEQQNEYDKAIETYKLIMKNDGTNEAAQARIAKVYLVQGKVDESLEALRELRAYATDATKVDFTLARILLEEERFTEAIDILTGILERDPGQGEARLLLALTYHGKGLDRGAVTLLQDVKPEDDGYEEATLLLVRIMRDNKEFDDAIALLNDKIANEQTRARSFYLMLAATYRDMKKPAKAEEIYQQAMTVYPQDTGVLFEYGVFLDEKGDRKGAIDKMQEILTINPSEPFALNYLGYTWADLGENLDKALEYTRKAVLLKPGDGFIRDSLGWVYYKMGKFDEAVEEMAKALELVPEDPTINEHMGDILVQTGKQDKALEAYERAMKLHKEDEKKKGVLRKIEALKK